MLAKVVAWLDNVLEQSVPEEVVAFCFNLYEDGGDSWSMELVGTASFDEEEMDWACDEVTDFGTREVPFAWGKEAQWSEILDEICEILKAYLENGTYADILKGKSGVGVGFVDGDIEIIYM